jgi:hypothetical protein
MRGFFIIISILFLASAGWFSYKSIAYGKEYKVNKNEYIKVLNFEERLLQAKEWIFTESEWRKRRILSEEKLAVAEESYDKMLSMSLFVLALCVVYLLSTVVLGILQKQLLVYLGIGIGLAAMPCLANGIAVPMMEISAFNTELTIPLEVKAKDYISEDIPMIGGYVKYLNLDLSQVFHGRMYYFYQSKSVLDLIFLLVKDGNWLVAICILCFSIVLPVFKLLITLGFAFSRNPEKYKAVFNFSYALGKWSMADVFVAALFLGFLSFYNMNTGVETEAKTLAGMYYFLGYCVLSIISSILTASKIKTLKTNL